MALVCPACGTENRSVAKFCIECIGALPSGFEATQLAPRPGPREPGGSEGMPSALAAFVVSPPAPMPQDRVRAAAPPSSHEARGRTGLWVSVGALAIALVVGAAGWAAAGAGGWYIYKEKAIGGGEAREAVAMQAGPSVAEPVRAPADAASTTAVPTPPAPADAAPYASDPAPSAPSPAVPSLASTLAPGEVLVASSMKAEPGAAAQVEAHSDASVAPAPARIPRKARPAPASASASAPAVGSLAKACGGMNFISAARCKAAECARPELRQTAECKVVLAQMRLMEEKRNPLLSN